MGRDDQRKQEQPRGRVAVTIILVLLVFSASWGNAAPSARSSLLSCPIYSSFSLAALPSDSSWLPRGGPLQALLTPPESQEPATQRALVGCIRSLDRSQSPSEPALHQPPAQQQAVQEQVRLWHSSESLLSLLRLQESFQQQVSVNEPVAPRDYFLAIGDLASLATRINWVSQLVKPLLAEDPPDGELQLQFGQASLKARLDFMAGLLQYVVESLRSSPAPLPSGEGVTLAFNFNGVVVDVTTALKGDGSAARGPEQRNQIGLDHISVTISNGGFSSGAELNPADFTINRGHLQLRFHLGLDSITSMTSFTREEGLTKEVLLVSAQWGGIDWVGQATFAQGLQEYKLQASFNPDLAISTSSLWTAEGFVPGFGFSLNFCVLGCGSQ